MRGPSKGGVDQAIGRSRGGPTTKIHVIVDALGNPLALCLTGGQVHDITQAEALAAEAQPEALLGDKGYDADAFIESLEGEPSSRSSCEVEPEGRSRLRLRPLRRAQPDRAFLSIHQTVPVYIATRYEKTARNFLAGLHLVCALAWLK